MDNRVARTEDIIWRRIEDEIVLITDDGLSLHVLNKTAAQIWEMCDGTHSPEDITAGLCERFDATLEEVTEDVQDTLDKLKGLGLVRRTEEIISQ
ncbi:MAG: PqqD family protein [Dehalococcoidales bacterium]|nr:MAG: PqqD family protein [Dehalococcoidales bacterium]